tara:strand:+ start:888 stop:1127 length:240 start_codon:yes stop_codon:yes gene_type:complete
VGLFEKNSDKKIKIEFINQFDNKITTKKNWIEKKLTILIENKANIPKKGGYTLLTLKSYIFSRKIIFHLILKEQNILFF